MSKLVIRYLNQNHWWAWGIAGGIEPPAIRRSSLKRRPKRPSSMAQPKAQAAIKRCRKDMKAQRRAVEGDDVTVRWLGARCAACRKCSDMVRPD